MFISRKAAKILVCYYGTTKRRYGHLRGIKNGNIRKSTTARANVL